MVGRQQSNLAYETTSTENGPAVDLLVGFRRVE